MLAEERMRTIALVIELLCGRSGSGTRLGCFDRKFNLDNVGKRRHAIGHVAAIVHAVVTPIELGVSAQPDLRTRSLAAGNKPGKIKLERDRFANALHREIPCDIPIVTPFFYLRTLEGDVRKLFYLEEDGTAKMIITPGDSGVNTGG